RLGGLPGFADESAGILKRLFNEGWTEFVQQYVDRGFESVHYKTKYDIEDVTLEALESAIFGFITAGVLDIGPKAITGTAMVLNVMGQEVQLNFQQMLKLYDAYKIPDINLRKEALINLASPLGIVNDGGIFNDFLKHLNRQEMETYKSINNLILDTNLENIRLSDLETVMKRFSAKELALLIKLNPNNLNRIIKLGSVESLATLLLDGTIDYEKNKYLYQKRFRTMNNVEFLKFLELSMKGDFGVDQGVIRRKNIFFFKNLRNKSKVIKLIDLKGYEDYLLNVEQLSRDKATSIIKSIVAEEVFYNQELEYLIDYLTYKKIDLKKYDKIINNFERIKKVEFTFVEEKLINMGFNSIEAHKILNSMDTVMGLCSYANIANAIILHFKNDIEGFKANFGYDMIKTYNQNTYKLNSVELMLDMFLFFNSDICGQTLSSGNPIFSLKDSKPKIIDLLSEKNIKGLSFSSGTIDTDLINAFFGYHNSLLKINCTPFFPSTSLKNLHNTFNLFDSVTIADRLKKFQEAGYLLSLGIIRRKELPINFNRTEGSKFLSTSEWEENDAHAVHVIGIEPDKLDVSSWGKELLVLLSELSFEERNEYIGPNGDIIKTGPFGKINGFTIPSDYRLHRIVPRNANMNLLWMDEIL
ncbi:MAG: hypothetical protein PHC42_02805, partial [Bacilli bacterium]|nr:hypothetical protein [Bacilli bacterium]